MKNISDNIRPIITLLINVAVIAYFFVITIQEKKPDQAIIIAMVGAWGLVNGYYFGSSTGQAKKDETINNLIEKQK